MNEPGKPQNQIKIHRTFLFARMNFTAVQAKIIDTLISTLKPDQTSFTRQSIKTSDLKDCYSKHMTTKDVDELLINLIRRYVKINDKEKKREWVIPIFSYIFYDYKCKKLCFQFNNLILKYLLNFRKDYLNLNLKHIFLLKSKHSIRIYKILKYYLNVKENNNDNRTFYRVTIDELSRILDIKYARIYDLKKWVLDVAKKELSSKTDLMIDYKFEKKYKKIVAVIFMFVKQNSKRKSPLVIDQKIVEKTLDELHEKADEKAKKTTRKYQKKSDKIAVLRQKISLQYQMIDDRNRSGGFYECDVSNTCKKTDIKMLEKLKKELDKLTGQKNMNL